jgi:hypothetical protein
MARKLGCGTRAGDYAQFEKLGSHAGESGNRHGVQQITGVMRSFNAFRTLCGAIEH